MKSIDIPFTVDQVAAFVAVVEEEGFAPAGLRLGRVQSAVSHAVKSLEAALGVSLFRKAGRKAVLTSEGTLLLESARTILLASSELLERANGLAGVAQRTVTLAVDPLFPTRCLTDACAEFAAFFPNVALRLDTISLGAVAEAVRAGNADLGVSSPAGRLEGLEAHHLMEVHLIPVCAAHHPLARFTPPVPRKELNRYPQLVIRDQTKSTPGHYGILSQHTWSVVDWTTKGELIRAGLAFGNLPLHAVAAEIAAGTLVQLRPRGWSPTEHVLPLRLIRAPARAQGAATRWLAGQLAALTSELPGPGGSGALD